jgi:hypothetical protein
MPLFFSSISTEKRTVVNVGGKGDSGFRSVAAGLIDNFLTHPQLNKSVLNQIVNRHFTYFPAHCSEIAGLKTSSDILKTLLKTLGLPELIQTLAYTLRQIAVDELVKNPQLYLHAFVQKNGVTLLPEVMRDPGVKIGESALDALAKALNVAIDVREITLGKELLEPPLRFNDAAENRVTNPIITIELKQKHYKPRLVEHAYFFSNAYDSYPFIKPFRQSETQKTLTHGEILEAIQKENKRFSADFEASRSCLMAKVSADGLKKDILMNLYIENRGMINWRTCKKNLPGLNYGDEVISHSHRRTHDEEVVTTLVLALSRAISLGQLSPDILEQDFTQSPVSK